MTYLPERAGSGPTPFLPDLRAYLELVDHIGDTQFNRPDMRRKPGDTLGALLYGAEVGISPMQALQSVHVIDGRPTLSAEAMRTLILQAGHQLATPEYTNEAVTVAGHRRDWPAERWEQVRWTTDDAKRAELLGKGSWKRYPRAMLFARASSELARMHFGDVLRGLSYTPEEVESIEADSRPAGPPPAPKAPPAGPEARAEDSEPATEDQRSSLLAAVEALPQDLHDRVQDQWMKRRLGGLKPNGRPLLEASQVADARALVDEATTECDRRRVQANVILSQAGIREDGARHATVAAATDGATQSTRALTQAQLEALEAHCKAKGARR